MPNKATPQTIIGIDPGYGRLGWAIGQISNKKLKIIDCGCIQTDSKKKLFERYYQLQQNLEAVIKQHHPQIAVIESLFFFKNKKTALQVSESRGIVIAAFMAKKIKIYEYTPLQIKQSVTGYGRADKKAVDKMVRMQLNLPNQKIIDDAMDAVAVVLTYFATRVSRLTESGR